VNFTISNFVVSGDGNTVYATIDSINSEENFYVWSASQGNALAPVASDWTFTSALNLGAEIDSFSIAWDSNLQTLVAWAPNLDFVAYAPRPQRSELDNWRTFFAKQAPHVVQLSQDHGSWAPAYGGGFDGSAIVIVSVQDATFFIAPSAFFPMPFVYDHYTGPVATFDDDNDRFGPVPDSIGQDGWTVIDWDVAISGAGTVNAVYYDGDLGLIVAGSFRTIGSASTIVNSITSFGGNLGAALGSGSNAGVRKSQLNSVFAEDQPGTINAVYVHDDYVYVGGDFDLAGAESANNVARYNVKTGAWEDLVGGVNGIVYAIIEFDDLIVFGGSFTFAGSTTRANYIAGYDPDKNEWHVFNQGVDGPVYALAKYDGDLLVAGSFGSASGKPINGPSIAYWDGKNWHAIQEKFDELDDIDECSNRQCSIAGGAVYDLFTWGDDVFFISSNSLGSFNDDGYFPNTFVSGLSVNAGPDTHPLIEAVDAEHECPEVLAAYNAQNTDSDGSNRADVSVDHRNLRYTWNGANGNVKGAWPKKH
jgi:hypothetical protein